MTSRINTFETIFKPQIQACSEALNPLLFVTMQRIICTILCFLVSTCLWAQEGNPVHFAAKQLGLIVEKQEALMQRLEAEADTLPESEQVRLLQEQISLYQDFLTRNSKSLEGFILYGKFLRSIGQDKAAYEAFLQAHALDPKVAVVKQQIANYLTETGRYAEAYPFFVSAVELAPKEPVYYYSLGEFLALHRKEVEEADLLSEHDIDYQMLKAFELASRYQPQSRQLALRYGQAFFDLELPQWAIGMKVWIDLFKSSNSHEEQDYIRFNQARILHEMGNRGEALSVLDEIVAPSLKKSVDDLRQDIGQGFLVHNNPNSGLEDSDDARL